MNEESAEDQALDVEEGPVEGGGEPTSWPVGWDPQTAWRTSLLSPEQERAAQLKALGRSDVEIAGEIGCNRATIWRWRNHVGFRLRVSELQAEAADAAASTFGELVRISMNVMRQEVERGNWRAAAQVMRLVGQPLVDAYRARKPRDVGGIIAILGLEQEASADLASIISPGRKGALLARLNELATIQSPEEFRDRTLASAAEICPTLGRSPGPLPRTFRAEELLQTLRDLNERVSMLLTALIFVADEGREFEENFSRSARAHLAEADLLLSVEQARGISQASGITAMSHLARALTCLLSPMDSLVPKRDVARVVESVKLAEAVAGLDTNRAVPKAELLSQLRTLDLAIATAAWAIAGTTPDGLQADS